MGSVAGGTNRSLGSDFSIVPGHRILSFAELEAASYWKQLLGRAATCEA